MMMKKPWQVLWMTAIGVVLFWVVAYTGVSMWGSYELATATSRQSDVKFDPYAIVARFPNTGDNATATSLYGLVEPGTGGFQLKERGGEPREGARGILWKELTDTSDEIRPFPATLSDYLEAHGSVFAAAYAQVRKEPPRWRSGLGNSDLKIEIPQIGPLSGLFNLVILDILENIRLGRKEKALEAFEAGWTVNQSMRERPELVSQIMAEAEVNKLAMVLRKMESVPRVWQDRVMEHDYRQSLYTAFEAEALICSYYLKNLERDPSTILATPYWRACEIDAIRAFRRNAVALCRQDTCEAAGRISENWIEEGISWWNIPGRVFFPQTLGCWREANKTMLRLEGTQKSIEVKEMIRIQGEDGPWRGIIRLPSKLCRGAAWIGQCGGDSEYSLTFSEPVPWLRLTDREERELLSVKWSTGKSQRNPVGL